MSKSTAYRWKKIVAIAIASFVCVFFVSEATIAADFTERKLENRTHTIKKSDTLWSIGRQYYGNRHYSRIISLHNNIKDVSKIRVGQTLQIPDLKTMLVKEGLCDVANTEVDLILKARLIFFDYHKYYDSSKNHSPDFIESAALLKQASDALKNKKNVKSTPKHMIKKLNQASRSLTVLARAEPKGSYFSKNLDMAEQGVIRAIYNGIIWARSGFDYKLSQKKSKHP